MSDTKQLVDNLNKMIKSKEMLLESYDTDELDSKRPDFHCRLSTDIKALKMAIMVLEGNLISYDEAVEQLSEMIKRNEFHLNEEGPLAALNVFPSKTNEEAYERKLTEEIETMNKSIDLIRQLK